MPLARFLHPDISEAVVIVVGFLAVDAFLVIDAGNDGCVTVHPNSHLRDLYDLYMRGGTGAVCEIAGLAVGAAIFESDDEVVIENRCEDLDFLVLVAVEKLELKGSNGAGVGRLLRS